MTPYPSRRDFLRLSIGSTLLLSTALACGDDDDSSSTSTSATPTTAAGGGTTTTTLLEPVALTALMAFPLFLTFIVDVTSVAGGFQESNGVDLKLEFAQSAPQALQQLAAGNVPVANNAPLAIVRADSLEGADFVSIATTNQESIYRLVSTEEGAVASLADLPGKTVGFPTLAGNAEQTFDLLMKGADLDPASVQRVQVGNDAAGLAFAEDGRVDVIFATLEAATGMQVAGLNAIITKIPDINPLLGFGLMVKRASLETHHDVLVSYVRAMHQSVTALLDPAQRAELLPKVRAQFDLPQLDDPAKVNPVIDALLSGWTAAGEENLMRNVPERWAEGVAGFEKVGAAAAGSDPTVFYTNDIVDEATSWTATIPSTDEDVRDGPLPPDLELAGVHKQFGQGDGAVQALAPIDLVLNQGEIVAVVGPSGCGKTTLLRILAGLTPPTAGSVRVRGREVWDGTRPDRHTLRELAVVPQEANLLPWMSVVSNVALPLRLRGVSRQERLERAGDLCELTGIGGFERKRPAQLSVGMRQRAAIARGLIGGPRILLLDEPFGALDAITRESMNLELERVWRSRPCTFVMVTHSISEAVFLADRVVSMTARPGRVAGITSVPFERPRPIELHHTSEFQEIVRGVRRLLAEAF